MEKVRGVGGIFIRCRGERAALVAWYREHLGLALDDGWGGTVLPHDAERAHGLTFSIFEADTDYFGDRANGFMVNFTVDDLDAMLAQLRAGGVEVDDRIDASEFGRFGWATDPEGNRIELWEPPRADAPPP